MLLSVGLASKDASGAAAPLPLPRAEEAPWAAWSGTHRYRSSRRVQAPVTETSGPEQTDARSVLARPGPRVPWLAWAVLALAFVGGGIGVARWASSGEWTGLTTLSWSALISAPFLMLALAAAMHGWSRRRVLADRYPEALVLAATRTDDARAAFTRLARAGMEAGHRFPIVATVVVASDGVTLWSGPPRAPHPVLRVPADRIRAVSVGDTREGTTRHATVELTVGADSTVTLPISPLGHGILGPRRLGAEDVGRAAAEMRERLGAPRPEALSEAG